MLQIGTRVKIIGLPADNKRWCIPECFIGGTATVVNIDKYNSLLIDNDGDTWNFPLDYVGVLEPLFQNRWNPTGYIPMLDPLSLP